MSWCRPPNGLHPAVRTCCGYTGIGMHIVLCNTRSIPALLMRAHALMPHATRPHLHASWEVSIPALWDAALKCSVNKLSTSCMANPQAALAWLLGGELSGPEHMLAEAYLRRWLRARRWKVDVAAKSILAHAEWRATAMPTGRVEPVGWASWGNGWRGWCRLSRCSTDCCTHR